MIKATFFPTVLTSLFCLLFLSGCGTGGGGGGTGDDAATSSGGSTGGVVVGSSGTSTASSGGGSSGSGSSTSTSTSGADAPVAPEDPGTTSSGGSSGSSVPSGSSSGSVDITAAPGTNARVAESVVGESGTSGLFQANVNVTNATSFQSLIVRGGEVIASFELQEPGGSVLLSTITNTPPQTTAFFAGDSPNPLTYPFRGFDDPVVNGIYRHTGAFGSGGQGLSYSAILIAKNDQNLDGGSITVRVLVSNLNFDPAELTTVLNSAVALFQSIYASIGITLNVSISDIAGATGIVPNPLVESAFYLSQTQGRLFELNIFVGEDVSLDGTTTPGNPLPALGVAAAIPGPAVGTSRSAVAISLNEHAGIDGTFSGAETDLLGETLAHEAGHYLGLFHPVEVPDFSEGDSLPDTALCQTIEACRAAGLTANLMFPTPDMGTPQRNLTSQQADVVNLQLLVD